MYDEPYRWVEAVRNRRDYLEEQLSAGSPIVALPYESGVLMATLGNGTPKLYEIYDQIAFGGIGHPADLEKLRNVVLDAAHVEGFNRSPVDVTIRRLMKFVLAPMVKQAFEEVLHAPYIAKIVMAEIGLPSGGPGKGAATSKPLFFHLNYDGVFEEQERGVVLAPTAPMGERMGAFLSAAGETHSLPLKETLQIALRTWALSQLPTDLEAEKQVGAPPTSEELDPLLKRALESHTLEAALLDRTQPGSSKYRTLSHEEIEQALKGWLK
jgi:proteasome alpha subunit